MLTYTIVHDGVATDVTEHVEGTPELAWNAIGGCETATVRLNLPHTTFPGLGRRSMLVVTDRAARPVWYGYCKDPGQVSDDSGEAWDLGAAGSMEAASLRVGRLVYADPDLSSWTRAKASVDSASVGQVDDEELTGWRIGHPQGQAIGTGALAGIEYRQLARSDQGIGRVTASITGYANDASYSVVVATYTAGTLTDSTSWPLADATTPIDLVAGGGLTPGCDAVQIGLVRAGGATNVTTDLAYVEVTGLTVEGSTLDRYGAPMTPGAPITSAAVVADLIGRGMLGPIDPDAAVVEDSGVVHTKLSWATGIRGAAALEELREADPGMTWMYGARSPDGLVFAWQAWGTGADAVRYDLTDQDTITASGTSELPGDRVLVIWTEDGTEHSLVVTDPETADDEYARDLDPISLGEATAAEAETAGREALTAAADAGRTITGVVNRRVLDRATGLMVEPWEVRPGCLARLEASGEVLRVQEVSYRDRDAGGLVELTLGAPPADLTSRMLRVIRGEVDPTAPLIPAPAQTPTPPTTRAPRPPELDDLEDQIEGVITTANGKNSITGATRAPTSSDPGVEGDTWYYFVGGNISAAYVHNGTGWVSREIRDEMIDTLSVGKIVGLTAAFLNATITYLTSTDISASTITASTLLTSIFSTRDSSDNNGWRLSGAYMTAKNGSGATVITIDSFGNVDANYVEANSMSVYGPIASTGTVSGLHVYATGNVTAGSTVSGFDVAAENNVTGLDLYATSQTGAAVGDAEFGVNGRVKRKSSSRRVKEDIEPLPLDVAKRLLDLEPVTFHYRDRDHYGNGRYPGAIAEQAADVGLDLWVTRDEEGDPNGLRSAELTMPLIALVRDLYAQNAAMAARLDALEES